MALAFSTGLAVAACGTDTDHSDKAASSDSGACVRKQDVQPIATRFPVFGEIARSEWCAVNLSAGRSDVPGPTDIRLAGELTAADSGRVHALLGDSRWHFRAASLPSLPAKIAQELPEGEDNWMASEEFDRSVSAGLYAANFYLSETSSAVVFDTVNPVSPTNSAPAVVE
ncbi:hypothetical protein [Actinacidiphila yeochonensis]|uniref:hypothetical protein n=1 Tax=Actinacidiphila yeochonensis TaxID=89050 RepID=UPI0012FE98D5|nr:hypothetical protein [Actinacidiphila yeochonensis]